MADPAHLEAVAKAMFSSHQGVRLGSYFFGWVGKEKIQRVPGRFNSQRSLIITLCLQTLAVSQFTKWCTTSWSSERGCFRFLTVSSGTRCLFRSQQIYMIVSGMGFTVT